MGIDKRLVKLWKTRRADVITAMDVAKELGHVTDEDITSTTELLDRVVLGCISNTDSK